MLYDLTAAINPNLVIYPGDPPFRVSSFHQLKSQAGCNLSEITLGNHIGTHIDFPAHVIENGKTSDDFSLDDLTGRGQVIEVLNCHSITREILENFSFKWGEIIFFKTDNSKLNKYGAFELNHVGLSVNAASYLIEKGVKMVGIDYLSVDHGNEPNLPVHRLLLNHDVLIVENLSLNPINPGHYFFYVAPLFIQNMDGLPARVFAQSF